jgi:hypothetical protein
LVVISVVFAVWLGFLVYLYFTTVYHRRSVAPGGGVSAAAAVAGQSSS